MSKISQKECVYAAVITFLEEHGRTAELDAGKSLEFSKSDKQTIVSMVCAARNEMELSVEADQKFNTEQKFKTYVIGLVNNWLRKDTRLNGGEKYIARNPGSRAGQGDEMLKALKALRSTLTESAEISKVEEAINARVAEIKASKSPAVTINLEALPEQFRHLVK